MTTLLLSLALLCLLFLSAVFSGSETGVYSISRVRLDAEARAGRRASKLLLRLLKNDSGFLVALLIGNNLMLELLTHGVESGLFSDLPAGTRELAVTLTLTPIVFLFAELLPKDLFRRRPHRFLALSSPILAVARTLFLPLSVPIYLLSRALERLLGLRPQAVSLSFRREEMLEILEEGTRTGALAPEATELVRNVLILRETPVQSLMIPWERVRRVNLSGEEADRAQVEASEFTRLPAVEELRGQITVVGYVHQLEILGEGKPILDAVRPLPRIAPGTPVDRALTRLRTSGQRLALVGTPEVPLGLVTLMDLMAAISRESKGRTVPS